MRAQHTADLPTITPREVDWTSRWSADSESVALDEASTLEMWRNANKRIEAAIDFYEAALKEAYPTGATGEVFYWWNEARKAVGRPYLTTQTSSHT